MNENLLSLLFQRIYLKCDLQLTFINDTNEAIISIDNVHRLVSPLVSAKIYRLVDA